VKISTWLFLLFRGFQDWKLFFHLGLKIGDLFRNRWELSTRVWRLWRWQLFRNEDETNDGHEKLNFTLLRKNCHTSTICTITYVLSAPWQLINRQLIDRQLIDRQLIDYLFVDQQLINYLLVDQQLINYLLVDQQLINYLFVDRQLIDRQLIDLVRLGQIALKCGWWIVCRWIVCQWIVCWWIVCRWIVFQWIVCFMKVDQLSVNQLLVDQLSVDELRWYRFIT
jgi:hypothetical protein